MSEKKSIYKLRGGNTLELSPNMAEFNFVYNCCLGERAPDYVKEFDRWLIRNSDNNGVGFILASNDLEVGEIELINGGLFIGLKPSILAEGLNKIIKGECYNQINTFYAHSYQSWLFKYLIKKLGMYPVNMEDEWAGPNAKYYAIIGEDTE